MYSVKHKIYCFSRHESIKKIYYELTVKQFFDIKYLEYSLSCTKWHTFFMNVFREMQYLIFLKYKKCN